MNKKGMTLVEVIVSAVILALTVGGLLYIFTTEKGAVAISGRNIQALDFAQQTMEELKNAVRADTWGEASEPLTLQGWTTYQPLSGAFGTKFSGQRRYKVEQVTGIDPDTGYREVTVEVDWTEPVETQ